MKVLRFVADFWYIPVLAIGAVLAFVLFPQRKKVMAVLNKELASIDAKRETRAIQLQLGAEQAKQHVTDKYKAKRETLDAEAEAKAQELEHDPVKLSMFLERITRE